jgi:hypothetical protein
MTAPRPKPARCMCGWAGELTAIAPCPSCGRDHTYRITESRSETLHALNRGEQPAIWPVSRRWLLQQRLIVPITPRMPPGPSIHVPGKRQHFAITEAGRRAIGVGGEQEQEAV